MAFRMPEFKPGNGNKSGALGMLAGLIPPDVMEAIEAFKRDAPELAIELRAKFETVVRNTETIIAQNNEIISLLKGDEINVGNCDGNQRQLTSGD